MGARATTGDKIDRAINRAIGTAAQLHFDRMWVSLEYLTCNYLFSQDERVFAFETFRRWLKNHFFCDTEDYRGSLRDRVVVATTDEICADDRRPHNARGN
jgi:hypothetical protein